MTIGMTMIARGRMLRDSYRIISARGNIARCWKNLIFACFFVLPIYDSFQESRVNLYIMLEHNEAGSLSLNRKKLWNFERIVNLRKCIWKIIFEKFNQFLRRWTKIWQRYEDFFLGHSDLQLFMSKYFI